MDKSALHSFATNARQELLEKVKTKAMKIGVTEDKIKQADVESSDAIFIDGRQLTAQEKKQRQELIKQIEQKGFNQVMEEVAYTWFNRFTALRFMEVNEYLPSDVRVLSSSNPEDPIPDIIKEALSLDFDIDKEWVYERKLNNDNDKLFQYLIIKQCNDLYNYLPFMFEKINDYTEILFPEGILSKDSFIRVMTSIDIIPEEYWTNVEIIGWLYQYYISEKKDRVFNDFKNNIKVTKNSLPSATQLFTSKWIVKYMVENSLGKIWTSYQSDSQLKHKMNYYIEDVQTIGSLNFEGDPEKIKFLDPCCGSGHILVYAFDLLYEMYLEKGYVENDIPKLIIEKNIYGLDIDNRATQLATFSLIMRAREKSRKVFRQNIKPNVYSFQESDWLTEDMISKISNGNENVRNDLYLMKNKYKNAKLFGSLIKIDNINFDSVMRSFEEYLNRDVDLFESSDRQIVQERFPNLILQSKILSQEYDVICTNPPYMGSSAMNKELIKFLSSEYKKSKKDLFSAMMERSISLAKKNSFISMITMESWMFLSSYEQLRELFLKNTTISSLIHMPYEGRGTTSLGINFGTTAFVLNNTYIEDLLSQTMRIRYKELDHQGVPINFPVKNEYYGTSNLKDFTQIPGSPIAYWISDEMINIFRNGEQLNDLIPVKKGMDTGNNGRFLRFWHEVNFNKIGLNLNSGTDTRKYNVKWVPYNKGGEYRKWFGNNEYVVNWENDGEELKKSTANLRSRNLYFKKAITWSAFTSGNPSFRISDYGAIFDSAGSSMFPDEGYFYYYLALMNSVVIEELLDIINPTINFGAGSIGKLPIIFPDSDLFYQIEQLAEQCVEQTKKAYSYLETSWTFKKNSLLEFNSKYVSESFKMWKNFLTECETKLKEYEEQINYNFTKIYRLQDTFSNEINEPSFNNRDEKVCIKSLVSYVVGCMFGRYSLDQEGLVYAGGEFDSSKYQTFKADEDNIIPIVDGPYFEDDIVSRFIDFVKVTFSEETLEENLDFIADTLGRRKNETSRETIRRYFLNEFFKDHVQTYKKRPIYWLFTSGKQKAFNCLVYMHRYDPTLLGRIRTDYLHEVQTRMDAEKEDLLTIIEEDSTSRERNQAKKDLETLEKKIEELKEYDEKLHHMADRQININLDDGVEENYAQFKDLLEKK